MAIRIRRIAGAAAFALIGALALAASADAAPGQLVLAGCQRAAESPPVSGCTPLEGLGRTDELAIGPDGRFAYASWRRTLSLLDRNRRTGRLSFVECVSAAPRPPCRDVPGFLGVAGDIAIPRDGRSLYWTAANLQRFVGFRRNPLDGRLELAFCRRSSYGAVNDPALASCPVGVFQEARQVETSRDGRAVYLADRGCTDNTGECFSAVATYRRDPATSALKHRGINDPATSGAGPFALGPGGTLYGVDSEWGTISASQRVRVAGLRRIQCLWPRRQPYSPRCETVPAMRKAQAIAVAPSGRSVVTAIRLGGDAGGLVVFRRADDGRLRFRSCLAPTGLAVRAGCRSLRTPQGVSLAKPKQLEFSPDGRSLYLVLGGDAARSLIRFKLAPRRGRIAFAQCFTPARRTPCLRLPELRGLIEISTAGRFLYAITGDRRGVSASDAVVRFRARRR
jgi:hypothetical protein